MSITTATLIRNTFAVGVATTALVAVSATAAHAEEFHGGSGVDRFEGGPEDDWVYGYGSGDVFGGNDGWDHLFGHVGNDTLWGDAGNDDLFGGAGRDNLQPGYGNDIVVGARGADDVYIFADGEPDLIKCGRGGDTVHYSDLDDNDVFRSCEGWDLL